MDDETFEKLMLSAKQAVAIHKGEMEPSRRFVFEMPDVVAIRNRQNVSQSEFARMLGISVATLQGWEQKRRNPDGPARVLLCVMDKHPEAVIDAVKSFAPKPNEESELPMPSSRPKSRRSRKLIAV